MAVGQDTDDAIARELRVRADAVALLRGGAEAVEGIALPGPDAPWTEWMARLHAYRRAAVAPPATGVAPGRPSVEALLLRVGGPQAEGEALSADVVSGLSSPFRAVRQAALDRAAMEVWRDPGLGVELAPWIGDDAPHRAAIDDTTAQELARALVRAGVPLAHAGSRTGWSDLELFRTLLATPAGRSVGAAIAAPSGLAGELGAALDLVGAVRAGVAPDPATIRAAAALSRRSPDGAAGPDAYDLDEAASAFVDALLCADPDAAGSASTGLVGWLVAGALDGNLDRRARERCVRGAARLGRPAELLSALRSLPEPIALELWNELDLRPTLEVAGSLAPWIEDARDDVREAVARALGRRYLHEGDVALEPAVLSLLQDDAATVRSLAFSWICEGGRAQELDEELYGAWLKEADGGEGSSERQRRWLAQLPRGVALPAFREPLLELVRGRVLDDPSPIELLGAFRGDAVAARTVRGALGSEVERVVRSPDYLGRLVPDGRAAALATALVRIQGDAAIGALDDAVARTMVPLHGDQARGDARPQLPKTAVALLARTARGQRTLRRYLAPDVPSRVRYEAALQLAMRASPEPPQGRAVTDTLVDGFGRVDGSLRMRAISALGGWRTEGSTAFLVGLVEGRAADAERHAAIEAIAAHGAVGPLDRLVAAGVRPGVPDLSAVEAAAHAARQLGRIAGSTEPAGPRIALGWLLELDARPALDEARLVLRGALLESLAVGLARRHESGEPAVLDPRERRAVARAVLRLPVLNARTELATRFLGRKLAPAAFRYRSECDAFRALSEAGLGDDVLAATEGWEAIDGRCLLELGRRAREGSDVAAALLRTAVVALEGERPGPDAQRRIAEARLLLARSLALTGGARALSEAERALAPLVVLVLRGRVSRGVLEVALGPAAAGPAAAPAARLAIAARLAALRHAIAVGDPVERARAERLARPWVALDAGARSSFEAILR